MTNSWKIMESKFRNFLVLCTSTNCIFNTLNISNWYLQLFKRSCAHIFFFLYSIYSQYSKFKRGKILRKIMEICISGTMHIYKLCLKYPWSSMKLHADDWLIDFLTDGRLKHIITDLEFTLLLATCFLWGDLY